MSDARAIPGEPACGAKGMLQAEKERHDGRCAQNAEKQSTQGAARKVHKRDASEGRSEHEPGQMQVRFPRLPRHEDAEEEKRDAEEAEVESDTRLALIAQVGDDRQDEQGVRGGLPVIIAGDEVGPCFFYTPLGKEVRIVVIHAQPCRKPEPLLRGLQARQPGFLQ